MMITRLCLLFALYSASSGQTSYLIRKNLPNEQHGIRGDLFFEKVGDTYFFRIDGFHYDGNGPETVVYIFRKGENVVARGGNAITIRYSDERETFPPQSFSGQTLRIRIPSQHDVSTFGTFTLWCRKFPSFFTRATIPDDVFDTPIGGGLPSPPSSYDNCEPLGDNLQVSWTREPANDRIFIRLCGCISAVQYMAFGISGSTTSSSMVGSDVVVAWQGGAVDYYLGAYAQCSPNSAGGTEAVCPDTIHGGFNNATLLQTAVNGGIICVDYLRPLSASEEYDTAINSSHYIVWGIGPRDLTTDFAFQHTERITPSTQITFDRPSANLCPAQSCAPPPVCPFEGKVFDVMGKNATFVAVIGQSGSTRGYSAITGQAGWGISWYLNDTIAPILRVSRGNTYSFIIYGGRNMSAAADFHPFYLTSSRSGGKLGVGQDSDEKTFSDFTVGDLCQYEESIPMSSVVRGDCEKTFEDYFTTLNLREPCDSMQPGYMDWTPDESTPSVLYYQCATHRGLGWRIEVDGGKSAGFVPVVLQQLVAALALLVTYANL